MSYEQINPIQQFNFQINRVLTYGDIACDGALVRKRTAKIRNMNQWKSVWNGIGVLAEEKDEFLRAAYAFRMAEFFMKATDENKHALYQRCIDCFYKAFDTQLHLSYQRYDVPFEGKYLNCIRIPAQHPKGTVLVCGGYDSFIEEFVLQVRDLADKNYDVILFEGPGQGRCLQQNLYFQYDFEKPTAAVLDYFGIRHCAMVGISWGGYFALRSAAFEKRIGAVAAYDVMDDGFEVMTHIFPGLVCRILRSAYARKNEKRVNALIRRLQKKSVLADWALSQGMYITGTQTPYAFYESISRHTLGSIAPWITQSVLLLAGEKDHYIPSQQFYRLKESLPCARFLSCRMFLESEHGEQHCQIGNHRIAVNAILDFLDGYFENCEGNP